MKLKQIFQTDENRAVSPVIGVILMVAITVILAAVIGMFVLGMGDSLGEGNAPSAQISLSEGDSKDVKITHNGGDDLDLSEFSLVTDDQVDTLSGELSAGQSTEVDSSDSGSIEVSLRHDPSGSVLTTTEITIETEPTTQSGTETVEEQ